MCSLCGACSTSKIQSGRGGWRLFALEQLPRQGGFRHERQLRLRRGCRQPCAGRLVLFALGDESGQGGQRRGRPGVIERLATGVLGIQRLPVGFDGHLAMRWPIGFSSSRSSRSAYRHTNVPVTKWEWSPCVPVIASTDRATQLDPSLRSVVLQCARSTSELRGRSSMSHPLSLGEQRFLFIQLSHQHMS